MSRKPKRQRKNPTEIKQVVPDQPPCMPTEFMDRIMGLQSSDIKLVIQKVLTDTDMKGSQDQLSIPKGQMRYDFLSREEQVSLEKKEADGKHFKGMEVPLLEPGLQESSIFLKKWKLGSSFSYMLSNPWINIATRNGSSRAIMYNFGHSESTKGPIWPLLSYRTRIFFHPFGAHCIITATKLGFCIIHTLEIFLHIIMN
ncbi:hypothetical protein FH972_005655 [Carpinus fangiana]|uniref:Uncharacterized protein n=1 Tax=Carpinus fangiana TaxID=176857 RepID=A0A5N6QQW9_9ROSI|nr:hypothetical protein FH972_005655 [Carpinus fangiana]